MSDTVDWFMGDTYRKIDLELPDWPMDLDFNIVKVYAAPFGGPMAVVLDPEQVFIIKGRDESVIRVFDRAGLELSVIHWNHGKLITMGWSDAEELIFVQDDGTIYIYDIFGKVKDSYNMGAEASRAKIVNAKLYQSSWGTGIAVMTTNGRIYLKSSTSKNFTVHRLPKMPYPVFECSCWEIITEGRNSYCLLGRDQEVIKLFPGESVGAITRSFFDKPIDQILLMSVSYNMQNLALYSDNGILWLGSVDMKRKLCEFDTGRKDVPKQIEWIVSTDNQADAVVVSYSAFLLVVNCDGAKKWFSYDPAVLLVDEMDDPPVMTDNMHNHAVQATFLVAEMDGVRIIRENSHELLQKIPNCVRKIFAINSKDPSSYLLEAYRRFEEKSYLSDEYLISIDELDIAVDECIEAAGYELCTATQKTLLKAAYFGKSFIPYHNPDKYMRMLNMLRVLNALNHPRIAMPLTYRQYEHLNPENVLSRLLFRKEYGVVFKVSKYLNLPESRILEHWAYSQVLKDQSDSEIALKIMDKLSNTTITGISFYSIAEKACAAGREGLGIKLLELESRVSLTVPLLLKLGHHDRAIKTAVQFGDPELITEVLLEIQKQKTLTDIHIFIREYPIALNIYKKILSCTNPSALYEFYNTEDDKKSIGEYNLRKAIKTNCFEMQLPNITNSYTQCEMDVEAVLSTDTGKLMKLQKDLAKKHFPRHDNIFYGMSLHDTIFQLLQLGDLKEAEKIKSDFKVPNKRFSWLRIRTMAEKNKWDELEKYAKTKKGPISKEAFVAVCLQRNNLHEARKYLLKCRGDRKPYWFIRAGLYEEAAECALKQKNLKYLHAVRRRALINENQELLDQINSYVTQSSSIRPICNIM